MKMTLKLVSPSAAPEHPNYEFCTLENVDWCDTNSRAEWEKFIRAKISMMKMTLRRNGGKRDLNDGVGLSWEASFKDHSKIKIMV